jgi:hypothetical protein
MKISVRDLKKSARAKAGFTLAEAIVATGVGGIMLSAFMGCFSFGLGTVQLSREDLRATQILLQRLERVRLCTFDQVQDTTYNPSSSTEYYAPAAQTGGRGGVLYTVTYSNSVPAFGTLPESYRTNMVRVTATATWTSGRKQHQRSMDTYVARYGMFDYISNPQ